MIYAKPTVRRAWAETAGGGDLVDPGDSYAAAGWLIGVKPPRQYMNWLENFVFNGIRYFCQVGVPVWDAAETYQANSYTRDASGYLYLSLINNNINNVPANTLGTAWANPAVRTPNATTGTWQVPNIAYLQANYLPVTATFAAINGSIANAQVPQSAVTQWQGALSIAFTQLTGSIANGQVPAGAVTQWQASLSIAWGQLTGTKNADQLLGLVPGPASSYAGNALARYDASGNLYAAYHNQASANNENPSISQILVTNGSDNFLRKASVAAVKAAIGALSLADFPASLALNGYQQLPDGWIIQWGQAFINGSSLVFFPIAFPNACRSFVSMNFDSTNQINIHGALQVGFVNLQNGTATVSWIAIGY